jgi:hypothetical protein
MLLPEHEQDPQQTTDSNSITEDKADSSRVRIKNGLFSCISELSSVQDFIILQ